MFTDWSKEDRTPPQVAEILRLLQGHAVLVGSAVGKPYRDAKDIDLVISVAGLRLLARAGHGYWLVRLGKGAFNLTALFSDGADASVDLFRGASLDCCDPRKNAGRLTYEEACARATHSRMIEGVPVASVARPGVQAPAVAG